MIPGPWTFALLALAALSAWKLVADDTVLDRPRAWVLRRLGGRGDYWAAFVTCPWCAGFWITVATYSSWIALGPGRFTWGELWMGVLVVFALRCVVGIGGMTIFLLGKLLD